MTGSKTTVFHVSSPRSLEAVVRKARNLLADDTVELDRIRIVVDDGEAIAEFERNASLTSELASLPELVEIAVCRNSLSGSTVDAVTEPERAEVVSSGVGELTRLQRAGAAYIRLCD
jgi:intracellular sulfur oxidation DsrE/DsrF family protein